MLVKTPLHNMILLRRFSKETRVKESCIQIIDYLVSVVDDQESSFHFQEMRENVDSSINDEDFITSVFYLTRFDFKLLDQRFSAFSRIDQRFIEIDKNLVLNMLKTRDFYNPFSGDDLSEEEFSNQILTYFVVTQFFLDYKNG